MKSRKDNDEFGLWLEYRDHLAQVTWIEYLSFLQIPLNCFGGLPVAERHARPKSSLIWVSIKQRQTANKRPLATP